jgi:UPF0042 nucleotide-binding protein
MKYVIITGMSGAGKSNAINLLEDMDYYCIDNMPPSLIPKFADLLMANSEGIRKTALVTDSRGGIFFDDLEFSIDELKKTGADVMIIFLEASDKTLIKRYKETRRSHPMADHMTVEDAIKNERKKLVNLRKKADYVIDTTDMLVPDFKKELKKIFSGSDDVPVISLSLVTFGFKKGLPLDVDMVFDLRVLQNPFYVNELRELSGMDVQVRDYVMNYDESVEYLKKVKDMVEFMLDMCVKEGRSHLIVGIGCTGGQHRSVTFGYLLNEYFKTKNVRVSLKNRDKR